jgi:unsaturated rhamnogalacturonyl hydrolase
MKMNFDVRGWLGICVAVAVLHAVPGVTDPAAETNAAPKQFSGASPLVWSQRLADSEMARLGDSLVWQPGGKAKWDYAAGLFTLSLIKLSAAVAPEPPAAGYVAYARAAIGSSIDSHGQITGYSRKEFQLDALNPGKTALALWTLTHEDRFRAAAAQLQAQLADQPRTPDGGFWHKQRYTNQMWLDGIFMAEPFYAQCGQVFGAPGDFDEVAKQIQLIDSHTYDSKTGLNYHGWDAARIQPWANPETGCSSNFWGRAEGWYVMALVDVLDFLPADHPSRGAIMGTLQKTARGIVKWQDGPSGLWWQVMDQGSRPGNYLEATASAMFVYTLAKGIHHGYLPPEYLPVAEKGYTGMLQRLIQPDGPGRWSLVHCCTVAGLGGAPSNGKMRDGSFNYYISEPVGTNDLKGVGPFILAGIELQAVSRANIR